MNVHLNIVIYGLVQGVFFRVSAKKEAEKLNIKGFAKNQDDGSVYIEAEGEEKSLDKFLSWCKNGPTLAKISNIKITKGILKNFTDFQTL